MKQQLKLIIAALVALGIAIPAGASMVVDIGGTVSGGVYTPGVQYTDNQAGVDSNPAIGIMDIGAFLNSIAVNFRINGFGATSGSPISSISMNANANLLPGAVLPLGIDIVISDTGFTDPGTPLDLFQTVNLLSSLGGIRAVATAAGYYGDTNTLFDVDGPGTIAATSTLLAGVSTNAIGIGLISGPVPYSLTTYIHADVLARGPDPIQNLQINADLSAAPGVPEPGTIGLLGAGFSLLALAARRRLRK